MIIDTHIHLYDERYKLILDEIIKESLEADVKKLVVVGFDYESSVKAVNLSNQYDFMYASVGLHPSEVAKETDIKLQWVMDLIKDPKVIAVGEIGLDYYWDKSHKELQKECFIKQIKIANDHNLPIIVHNRDASLDTYNILRTNPAQGVLHCYSSSLEMAREFVKLGYYLGIGGVLTFKNSKEIKEVVREIDLKFLLTETDGPYLAPSPFRGKLNRPSYLKYIIEEISLIKKLDYEYVMMRLKKNAEDLFRI